MKSRSYPPPRKNALAFFLAHIKVLDWFSKSSYKFKYHERAINMAAGNGHIKVLDWFSKSSYEFRYNENAIDSAAGNGYCNVLDWFSKSNYKFKYSAEGITTAIKNGFVSVLKWFDRRNQKVPVVSTHSTWGFIPRLQEREFYYCLETKDAINLAAEYGKVNILEWFDNSVYKFNYSFHTISLASKNGARLRSRS